MSSAILPQYQEKVSTAAPPRIPDSSPSIDDGSAALILRLQIQDIDEFLPKNSTSPDVKLSSFQRSLLAQREEYERRLHLLGDGQINLRTDADVTIFINISEVEGRRSAVDLEWGRGYGSRTFPGLKNEASTRFQRPGTDLRTTRGRDNDIVDELHKRRLLDDDLFGTGSRPARGRRALPAEGAEVIDLTESLPPSPTRSMALSSTLFAAHSPEQRDLVNLPCISCGEEYDVSMLAHMSCEHDYCQECLQTLLKNSLQDEALYPPRCCRKPFEMDDMRPLLIPELISDFHEKKIEFSSSNRLYCVNPACSTFLFPANIEGDVAECPMCMVTTYTICKAGAHQGDCPQDEATQQVLALAAGKGWKRCPKCMALVEKQYGCDHMACRCKAQWCYKCGAQWKTCGCR